MPSKNRRDAAGALHHVGFQGNNHCRIVRDEHDVNTLALIRREAAAETGVTLLSYVDLDTHSHLLVRMREANLARFMQLLLGRYARAFNRRHGLDGHLFRSPFWSKRTTDEPQLLMALVYVALNPVRHGLCLHPCEWPRGSYHELAGLSIPSGNVDVMSVWDMFDPRDADAGRRGYVELIEAWCRRVHDQERAAPLPG